MWIQDLLNQLPHWKKLWNHEGNLLLEKTIKLINKKPIIISVYAYASPIGKSKDYKRISKPICNLSLS